jgi:two-component system response regulator
MMKKAMLIVENSEEDVRTIKGALRDGNLSHQVTTVSAADEAKARLASENGRSESGKLGIVLVNIHDATCKGLDFLEWLREQPYFPTLLIVALTERSQLRDVVKAYELGAHTFLVKPVHTEDIKTLAKTYRQYCA